MNISVIVPIAKDRHGDMGNPDNYKGIAISSVVSKALEHVILIKWGVYLSTSAQQFGFKRNHSCMLGLLVCTKRDNRLLRDEWKQGGSHMCPGFI